MNFKLKIATSYFLSISFVLIVLMIRNYFWSNIILIILDGLILFLVLRAAKQLSLLREEIRTKLDEIRFHQLYLV